MTIALYFHLMRSICFFQAIEMGIAIYFGLMKKLSFLFAIAFILFAAINTSEAQVTKNETTYDFSRYVSCIDENLTGTVTVFHKWMKNSVQSRFHGEIYDSDGNVYMLNSVTNMIVGEFNHPWITQMDISDEFGNTVYILHSTRMFEYDPIIEEWVFEWEIKNIECFE